ncbi:MAG: hypothetical protein IKD70_02575, partial [Eggerthellaceae bacterium]|nr:hypothetical protein [Eggerthellaceae bacterium]
DRTHHFIVRMPVRDNAIVLGAFLLLEAIALYLMTVSPHRTVFVVAGILLVPLFLAPVAAFALFRMEVDGTRFSVRTMSGKRFGFGCSEITDIVCREHGSLNGGATFHIVLTAASREVRIDSGMQGFSLLAGFLLEQLDSGTIIASAAPATCRRELRRYADGEIYGRRNQKS